MKLKDLRFRPSLIDAVKGYRRQDFTAVVGGFIVSALGGSRVQIGGPADLTVAVQVGLVLASLLFIMRISSLIRIERVRLPADLSLLPTGRTVGAWRVFGSLFFGSVGKLEALLNPAEPLPDVMVLEMHLRP